MFMNIREEAAVTPKDGRLAITIMTGERPTLCHGKLVYDPAKTKVIRQEVENNAIMKDGRAYFASVLAQQVPANFMSVVELGVGAYGPDVQASNTADPPDVNKNDHDLIVPFSPRRQYTIDVEHGITVPSANPLARTFSVLIDDLTTTGFDVSKYIGVSEIALRFGPIEVNGEMIPGPLVAKRHKKSIPIDPENFIFLQWTIQF